MLRHPLVHSLLQLRGNPRAAVYTEPLWGIPYNLYAPYVSVYMLSLGLKDSQIGLLVTVGLVVQLFSALASGPITDKLGRRNTTAIFDFFCWSIPTLIWAIAQDFRYFLVAALINGLWRITHTSWSCLMVEDADHDQLMDMYSWVYISGLLSAFFAPIAGLLINQFTLVPTMRGLYFFAFVMMTSKFVILYVYSTETKQGKIRMEETRHQPLFSLLGEYRSIVRQLLSSRRTLFTLGIMLTMGTATTINNTFWAILVTQRINVPESNLALFSTARSIIMLLFFFLLMPRIREMHFRNPMLVGFLLLAVGQVILVIAPPLNYGLLVLSILLEACSYAAVSTQIDRMIVVTVDASERARISALMLVTVILFTTPFGWIAGQLSEINRVLPFLLNTTLYIIGAALVVFAARYKADRQPEASGEVEILPAASAGPESL